MEITKRDIQFNEDKSLLKMKIYYDNTVDVAYIELSKKKPDGVVEISDYVNLDTTKEGEITGIELPNASK